MEDECYYCGQYVYHCNRPFDEDHLCDPDFCCNCGASFSDEECYEEDDL